MRLHHLAVLLLGLASAASAQATINALDDGKTPVQMDVNLSISEQLSLVEAAVLSEHYKEIGEADRMAVRDALGRIRAHVGSNTSVDGLSPDIRTAVFNDQELVNSIMTRAHADSRLVCERVRLTGSNRRQQACMTVAEKRELKDNSQDILRTWHRWNMRRPGE